MQARHNQMEMDDDEEELGANSIDRLQEHGINVADINKLKSGGIHSCMAILQATKKELEKIKGITEQKIEKMMEAASKIENAGFITGTDMLLKRKKITRITTGSKKFDTLLGGSGVESMSITECFGEFRTGKTQLCHTQAVTAQLPKEQGGGGGKVIFIDSEGTFRPENIEKIADRFGQDGDQCQENISYCRVHTTEHKSQMIVQCAALLMEDHYSLMIVDSIMALFRVDYSGRGELSARQQALGQIMSKLTKLAEQFNIAVVITNQVTADPGATMSFGPPIGKPVGGNILAHASTTRLQFRKGKGDDRLAKIYDSPCLPESECVFRIGESGITDSDD